MKLGRWIHKGKQYEGVFLGDSGSFEAVPFTDGTTVQSLLEAGLAAALAKGKKLIDGAHETHQGSEVSLLAPFQPATVRDGVAFEAHVEGVVKSVDNSEGVTPEWYDFPTFYFTNPHAIIGPDVTMTPPPSERLDYELELGVVVGATPTGECSNLTPDAAADAIFGYTVLNDWSARDIQAREMKVRLGPAKGKDFATTIGPWIVTADEFAGVMDAEGFLKIRMQVFVNDKLYGEDLASNIGWPLKEMVAYASRNTFVRPGDLIGSGTCGAGCMAELWGRAGKLEPAPLKAGDKVTMTIERIGTITNVVGEAVAGPAIPRARKKLG
jgi:2-keto-4-pentenoate hydratase/2-oxohepta-3-ene-1,7-dioic acid hydratase in catechol pathway